MAHLVTVYSKYKMKKEILYEFTDIFEDLKEHIVY